MSLCGQAKQFGRRVQSIRTRGDVFVRLEASGDHAESLPSVNSLHVHCHSVSVCGFLKANVVVHRLFFFSFGSTFVISFFYVGLYIFFSVFVFVGQI